jgi:1-deoxy-D-xylulose-5-phosphate reductoisomerase
VGPLTFFEPDPERFPALRLAREALEEGGTAPVVLNAANEVAVAAFLERRLRFIHIAEMIEQVLGEMPGGAIDSIEACVAIDEEARARARRAVEALARKVASA